MGSPFAGAKQAEVFEEDCGMAKTETQTVNGQCPDHGNVESTRELPTIRFPVVYFTILRTIAKRRPFTCPQCGSPVKAT